MNSTSKIVLYHGSCHDGVASAAVFKMKYSDSIFIPVKRKNDQHALELLDAQGDLKDREVYFLDNSFLVEELLKRGAKVTIIDHHESEVDRLEKLQSEGKIKFIYNNDESGATLVWKTFFPDKELPMFLKHIRDLDLWKNEYEETDLIGLYGFLYLDNIDKFIELIKTDIKKIYEEAKILQKYRDKLVDYYLRNAQAFHMNIDGKRVKVYNVASVRHIVSLVGNILSTQTKEAVGLFKVFGENEVLFSFRSTDSSRVSALELAKALGGGGHKNAAGASITFKEFISLLELD